MYTLSTFMTPTFRPATNLRASILSHRRQTLRTFSSIHRMSSTSSQQEPGAAVHVSQPDYTLATPDDVKDLSHHEKSNALFQNPWPSFIDPGGFSVALEITKRKFTGVAKTPDATPPTVNVVKPKFLPSRESNGALRATWLGHASFLVEFPSGLRVVFDPVFEERCSPISFLGPKRFTEAPCQIEDIPIVDVVVISHSECCILRD